MPDEPAQSPKGLLNDWRLWIALVLIVVLLMILMLVVSLWPKPPAPVPAPIVPVDQVIRVQAYIDGRSRLAFAGKTAQWFHLQWAAPGKHGGLDKPTVINGQDWFPEWPDIGDAENRNKMVSNKYDHLDPPLPAANVVATIKKIEARGNVNVVQQPKAANKYTLIVEFDDSRQEGPADYDVEIHCSKK